jgi:hypothetical protein
MNLPMPKHVLAMLTLAVVAVHLLVIQAGPAEFSLQPVVLPVAEPVAPRALSTRRIEAPAPPARPKSATRVPQATPAQPAISAAAQAVAAAPELTTAPAAADLPIPASQPPAPAPADKNAPAPRQEPATAPEPAAAPPEPPAAKPDDAPRLALPASVRLKYDMNGQARGLNYVAGGVMTWVQDGNQYEARMVVSAFLLGSRSMSSTGELTADGIAPKRFADKSRTELATHFQPDIGRITFSNNAPDAPWRRGAQDRLSVFFQLSALLAGDPARFTPGTKVPMYTAGPRDADSWVFTVGPSETLTLPIGQLPVIRLLRDPRREYDQKVEVWLAPSLGFLPVRIKLTQSNGDFLDQQLASTQAP